MNGELEFGSLDRRPIITCAGELEVFAAIEERVSAALPKESCEWRRALGRPVRSVHISATFTPFSAQALPKPNQWDLIRQPLFHIYWTECTDMDLYKSTVKDDIDAWMKELQARDCFEFLVVVVENYDGKRPNKLLPRTTVLDKIRTDFASKQGDRCISVINPQKSTESKSTESWRSLVQRIRHLLLVAYAKAVERLEDYVRMQRDKRTEPNWNFIDYMQLQEELAQVLEMLGLYDEALRQYDELDALLSEFINLCEYPNCIRGGLRNHHEWLKLFRTPLERWHGLDLGQQTSHLSHSCASILELRAYLFGKQAQMLLLVKRVWQMAARCLPFLHGCVRELSVLEVSCPAGAVNCWLFLAAMKVLQTCDQFNHTDEVEEYSLHTAPLWQYAGENLRKLGELCGLLPNNAPTSEQLHIVVGLSAGMGDNVGQPGAPSATDKLKQALCSQQTFNHTYLELCEQAMCTYKHVGRLRCARLVGRQVATFYLLLGEFQTAAAFLTDAIRTFEQDGWHELVAHTYMELSECHRRTGNMIKLIKCCVHIVAAAEIDILLRWSYMDELRKCLLKLNINGANTTVPNSCQQPQKEDAISISSNSSNVIVPFERTLILRKCSIETQNNANSGCSTTELPITVVQHSVMHLELVIESNFPREVICDCVQVTFNAITPIDSNSTVSKAANTLLPNLDRCNRNRKENRLNHFFSVLEYNQDNQLNSANTATSYAGREITTNKNANRTSNCAVGYDQDVPVLGHLLDGGDSQEETKLLAKLRAEISSSFLLDNRVVLKPGQNLLRLTKTADISGTFLSQYICVRVYNSLHLVHSINQPLSDRLCVLVKAQDHSVQILKERIDDTLLVGIPQTINMIITIGSCAIDSEAKIKVTGSHGLRLSFERLEVTQAHNNKSAIGDTSMCSSLEFQLGDRPLFSSTRHKIYVRADPSTIPTSTNSPLTGPHANWASSPNVNPLAGNVVDHHVSVHTPWRNQPEIVPITFACPLLAKWRLQTVLTRKFLQISVHMQPLGEHMRHAEWELMNPNLEIVNVPQRGEQQKTVEDIEIRSCQKLPDNTRRTPLISNLDDNVAIFLWEMKPKHEKVFDHPLAVNFSIDYNCTKWDQSTSIQTYHHSFQIVACATLYMVTAKVEPTKGSGGDFCRMGVLCHLEVSIEQRREAVQRTGKQSEGKAVMYEVLSERNVWAVVGRTAGIVTFSGSTEKTASMSTSDSMPNDVAVAVVDVMPLISGHLPLPHIRLSKYIPADSSSDRKGDAHPRLEPFLPGQVYNRCKGQQVHVIAASSNTNVHTMHS